VQARVVPGCAVVISHDRWFFESAISRSASGAAMMG
jgi:ATPase subunit of ABC transporter with duplicated ATPase domains